MPYKDKRYKKRRADARLFDKFHQNLSPLTLIPGPMVLDSTTLDTGILTGDASMREENSARLTYLRLQSEASAGDLVLTSGYGEKIPQGLTVGYLSGVVPADTGLTKEGAVALSARPENARQVFVITDFTVTQTSDDETPEAP